MYQHVGLKMLPPQAHAAIPTRHHFYFFSIASCGAASSCSARSTQRACSDLVPAARHTQWTRRRLSRQIQACEMRKLPQGGCERRNTCRPDVAAAEAKALQAGELGQAGHKTLRRRCRLIGLRDRWSSRRRVSAARCAHAWLHVLRCSRPHLTRTNRAASALDSAALADSSADVECHIRRAGGLRPPAKVRFDRSRCCKFGAHGAGQLAAPASALCSIESPTSLVVAAHRCTDSKSRRPESDRQVSARKCAIASPSCSAWRWAAFSPSSVKWTSSACSVVICDMHIPSKTLRCGRS